MMLELMYITNNTKVALIAQKNGVERIWIDLEVKGKEERQKGLNSVKSKHSIEDIYKIKPLLTTSKMMVRINPWNENSVQEVEDVIRAGADVIMLPMWKTVQEVQDFVEAVKGRAKVSLLLETREAEACLDSVLSVSGIDEIHIGLNDLHLSYNLKFMFELLANGTVERLCRKISSAGIRYGFGGIAKLGCGELPAEKVLAEHYRLGSQMVILSRSFCNVTPEMEMGVIEDIFASEIKKLREYEQLLGTWNESALDKNQAEVIEIVQSIVKRSEE